MLAKWYYKKYEEIRSVPEEVKKARLHNGLYGYFVPEIYPLVLYALWRFSNDYANLRSETKDLMLQYGPLISQKESILSK